MGELPAGTFKPGCGEHWGTASSPVNPVIRFSGGSIWLHPPIPTKGALQVKWHVRLTGKFQWLQIWSTTPNQFFNLTLLRLEDRLEVQPQNCSLKLLHSRPQDSGQYCLEVTDKNGTVHRRTVAVMVVDRVREPQLQVQAVDRNASRCHLVLSCSVPGGNTVNLTWSRDNSQLRRDPGPHARLQLRVDANNSHVYACNASDAYSWAQSNFSLNPGCMGVVAAFEDTQRGLPLWLVYLGVPLAVLLLGVLSSVLLWRRKGRCRSDAKERSGEQNPPPHAHAQDPPPAPLPTDLTSPLGIPQLRELDPPQTLSSLDQEHSPSEEGSTVYSQVQSRNRNRNQNQNQNQASLSTPQDSDFTTLYALVQPSQKVGRGQPRTQNPARLSRKELQNFEVYC
ncbi:natural killer cell receptor 2B4 [Sorex fumeus]|uniref:natural killer cell receptor 2B4 n=1 Tax=Sorex fumeus TaxID=62283 RepID=UPI0024ACB55F|nr:natural killer cell receptor 2B4 [Sorex fumeus]